MADARVNSGHLRWSRRHHQYRSAREVLFGARGWLTVAAERVRHLLGGADDWPSLLPVRAEHLLPGPKYLLIDPQAGYGYPLQAGLNTVGRSADNDVVLDGSTVSRRHCVILVHAWGGCELHDTASRNGTFVNGQPCRRPVRLAPGDEIRVSETSLLLVREDDCRAVTGATPPP